MACEYHLRKWSFLSRGKRPPIVRDEQHHRVIRDPLFFQQRQHLADVEIESAYLIIIHAQITSHFRRIRQMHRHDHIFIGVARSQSAILVFAMWI